jgi:hypothetical protein
MKTAKSYSRLVRDGKICDVLFFHFVFCHLGKRRGWADSDRRKWRDTSLRKALIANYAQRRHGIVAVATINRELATLRRILYSAHDWNKIAAGPRIKMLKGERGRDFVLSHQEEKGLFQCRASAAQGCDNSPSGNRIAFG